MAPDFNVTATDSVWHAVAFVINTTSSAASIDGSVTTGTTGSSSWGGAWRIGAATTPGYPGNIAEVRYDTAAFSTTAGTGQTCLLAHDEGTYYGITVSC